MKKTHSKAQNGSDSVKALPISSSEVTPHKPVAIMMIDRPIKPTAAKCKAKPITNQTQHKAWMIRRILSRLVKLASLRFSTSTNILCTDSGIAVPKPNQWVFSKSTQVLKPQITTGTETGETRKANSMKSQPATPPTMMFCGSPTKVQTPPMAVPTAACIKIERKKARKVSKSCLNSSLTKVSLLKRAVAASPVIISW